MMKRNSIVFFLLFVLYMATMPVAVFAQKKGFEQTVARDLVGQVVTDPQTKYFPEEWKWQLQQGEVLSVEILKAKNNAKWYVANINAHLKRRNLKIDARMFVKYHFDGKKWLLVETRMKSLSFPKQKDFSQYIKLYMDYDFMPAFVAKNTSDKTLFVHVAVLNSKGETEYFNTIIDPYKESTLYIGPAPEKYKIVFAYMK